MGNNVDKFKHLFDGDLNYQCEKCGDYEKRIRELEEQLRIKTDWINNHSPEKVIFP